MSEIPSPIPPKKIFKEVRSGKGSGSVGQTPTGERSPLTVLLLQFFVIPLLIVLFCVGLYFIFRWLTFERRDVGDYLSALNAGPPSGRQEAAFSLLHYIEEAKRWQSLSDLNDQLRFDREKFLSDNPGFVSKLVQAFREARGRDPRVAQYLSQVLALVGGPEAADVLLETLKLGGSPEQDIYVMIALGKLQDERAIPLILERLRQDDPGVRYAALFSLGFFGSEGSVATLKKALNDPDPLTDWNAAFSLARLSARGEPKHPEAVPVLLRLLDGPFVERVASGRAGEAAGNGAPVLSRAQVELYRTRAVQLLGIYMDEKVRNELQRVADHDPQLSVRQAAIDVLRGRKSDGREQEFSGK